MEPKASVEKPKESHRVTSGPSKLDLMLALFDKVEGVRRIVRFQYLKVDPPPTSMELQSFCLCDLVVNSVAAEDGSCESWIIKGGIVDDRSRHWIPVDLYYRTDNRTGRISIEKV